MAWEWSYTAEGEHNAYHNLHAQDREFLEVCYAENRSVIYLPAWHPNFAEGRYRRRIKEAKTLPSDVLADFIWEKASQEIRTCENGGFEAWVCPFGCHTVSFDDEGNSNDN